jgi:hypothetical protein
MNVYNPNPAKKAKYIASILYLLVLAFIVGGSYLHQQQPMGDSENSDVIQFDQKLIE